jgi:hypothetical protein
MGLSRTQAATMVLLCVMPDCDEPRSQGKQFCAAHLAQWKGQRYGMCIHHPDRPAILKGAQLCTSCQKNEWRARYVTTGDNTPTNQQLLAFLQRSVEYDIKWLRHHRGVLALPPVE